MAKSPKFEIYLFRYSILPITYATKSYLNY